MEIHPTSEAVIKAVARKLRYYIDVRRRELDFDLSGPQKPVPLWKEPAVQGSVARFFHSQHDRHVKHYFRETRVKKHLQHMEYVMLTYMYIPTTVYLIPFSSRCACTLKCARIRLYI
jgi:hypothetical protein